MKLLGLVVFVLSASLVASCASAPPAILEEPAPEVESPIREEAIEKVDGTEGLDLTDEEKSLIAAVELSEMQDCELPKVVPWAVGFGFPRADNLMRNTGTVSGLVVFVEFEDVSGSGDTGADFESFTTRFIEFYRVNSYGNLNIEVDYIPEYLPIPQESSAYGMDTWDSGNPASYFRDGVMAAAQERDISNYDFFVVLPPPSVSRIIYGPAFPDLKSRDVSGPPEIEWLRGTVGGADQRTASTGWVWLAHEFGHLLGMDHQYNIREGAAPPVWDLMDNVYTEKGPGLFAWHRYQMGWMSSPQVRCIDLRAAELSEGLHYLGNLNAQNDDVKALIIRTSSYQALVLEARLPHPLNDLHPDEGGVVAYVVDTSLSGEFPGPIRVLPEDTPGDLKTSRTGDSFTWQDFRIEVVRELEDGFLVNVLMQ